MSHKAKKSVARKDSDNENAKSESELFVECCASGDLLKSMEIYEKIKDLPVTNQIFDRILQKCCENGTVDIARWIRDIHDFRFYDETFPQEACKNGSLDMMKFFDSIGFDIHRKGENLLQIACEEGHVSIAQWLYKMNAVINYECLRKACINNHLDVVNWIVDVRNLAKKNNSVNDFDKNLNLVNYGKKIRQCDISDAFAETCKYGYLDIAMVLYNNWIDYIQVRNNNDIIFKNLCAEQRNFASVIYNVGFDNGNPTTNNKKKGKNIKKKITIETRNYDTLIYLCKNGDIDDIEWFCAFCESMGDPIDWIKYGKECFKRACTNRSYKIAKWIYNLNPLNWIYIVDLIEDIQVDSLIFLDLSRSTIYLLMQCKQTSNFDADFVDEVDELAIRALISRGKIDILKMLENKFDSITLETNDKGKIIDCHLDRGNVKSARKI